jgi:putative two-component system response regulator
MVRKSWARRGEIGVMNFQQTEAKQSRILVVDDNAINVRLLEDLLTLSGYGNVFSTTDPTEVAPLHVKWNFDIILLDIRMPNLDGFGVMRQLREVIPPEDYVPILAITAETDMETRLRAFKEGAKDFLTKPFSHLEAMNRIENMLEVRALYTQRQRQNAVLEEKVRERTLQLEAQNLILEDTSLEIIRRLGRAGEYRDNETGMHVIRMSKGCKEIALAAGLNEDFAEDIHRASPMHDVGKIGVPDNVLLKPGKLDAGEWDIMKTHADMGADIIGHAQSDILDMARTIALTHHEKFDGSGYPNGLAGEDIPIEGRIAAVSDVFDALTSVRPYKEAWPADQALQFINDNSGTHFDPALVRIFNDIFGEIMAIKNAYAD